MGRAIEVDVPGAVKALRLLERVAYADAFCAATSAELTHEEWLRAVIGDSPGWFRWPWLGFGRAVLGAQVGPVRGSSGHVAGWEVLHVADDACAIGIDASRGLSARLISVEVPGHVLIATQIGLEPGLAQRLWPGIRRGHRHFLPYLVDRAVDRVERHPPAHGGSPVAA